MHSSTYTAMLLTEELAAGDTHGLCLLILQIVISFYFILFSSFLYFVDLYYTAARSLVNRYIFQHSPLYGRAGIYFQHSPLSDRNPNQPIPEVYFHTDKFAIFVSLPLSLFQDNVFLEIESIGPG